MAQAPDLVLDNQTFPATRAELNLLFSALGTANAGDNPPSVTYPCMWWACTATSGSFAQTLCLRNIGNTGWTKIIDLATMSLLISLSATGAAVRTKLTSSLSLYVNKSTGSDSNPGTSAGTAFQTINAAIRKAYSDYDFAGNGLTIVLADAGTPYSENLVFEGRPPGLAGYITIQGNFSVPQNTTIEGGTGSAVSAVGGARVNLNAVGISANGSGGRGLYAQDGSIIYDRCYFGYCDGGAILVDSAGTISVSNGAASSNTIVGNGAAHVKAVNGGTFNFYGTLTFTGTPAYSVAFLYCLAGVINWGGPGLINLFGGATGQKYIVTGNGLINTGGLGAGWVPGSIAGASSVGGQFA